MKYIRISRFFALLLACGCTARSTRGASEVPAPASYGGDGDVEQSPASLDVQDSSWVVVRWGATGLTLQMPAISGQSITVDRAIWFGRVVSHAQIDSASSADFLEGPKCGRELSDCSTVKSRALDQTHQIAIYRLEGGWLAGGTMVRRVIPCGQSVWLALEVADPSPDSRRALAIANGARVEPGHRCSARTP